MPSNVQQKPAGSPAPTAAAVTQLPAPTAQVQQPLPTRTSPAPPADNATPALAPARAVEIVIKDFSFGDKNAPVTVGVGTTVVWQNTDDSAHTVTADDKAFDSGDMLKSEKFEHTFTQPGEYPYYCTWHGGPGGVFMASKVIVTP